jgi:hypothetical protein
MDTVEGRLQRRFHTCLYALVFLGAILGLSVLLENISRF